MKLLAAILLIMVYLVALPTLAKEYSDLETARLGARLAKVTVEAASIRLQSIFTNGGGMCVGDNDCCTSSNQCSIGEGDCDSNRDCAGELVCGNDNCGTIKEIVLAQIPPGTPHKSAYEQSSFSGTDDCCWFDSELAEFAKTMVEMKEEMGQDAFEREMMKRMQQFQG